MGPNDNSTALFAVLVIWVLVPISLTQSGCVGPISLATTFPPSITVQPANQIVALGHSARFAVAASGTPPLTYQWQSDGRPILGATLASFTPPSTTTFDNGTLFSVVVTNSVGTVTSTAASLTVESSPVAITLSPDNVSLTAGSTQQFLATVTGTSDNTVIWTLGGTGCPDGACGTISNNGFYVAPASLSAPAVVVVNAASVADPTKSAAVILKIAAMASVWLSISPTSATVPTSGTHLFRAVGTGASSSDVNWSLSGTGCSGLSCGTLASSLSSAVYIAPDLVPSPATVSVVATSVVDLSESASANITIVPVIAVTVTPVELSITGGATQQFAAAVLGSSNTSVAWTLSGPACSGAACGTISSSGLYSSPMAAPSTRTVTVTATSIADSNKSASANLTIQSTVGRTYYLAPAADGGNDSNNGLSTSAPWLSPNHAVNCGDVILAVSGDYSSTNFYLGKWGTVTCAANNNVAWLRCETFDACKIFTSSHQGMWVDASYWGVQGWEITTTGASGSTCFFTSPTLGIPVEIHHIIFADDVANGCQLGGFELGYQNNTASVDYVAFVGNIAYNAAQGSFSCNSGLSFFVPIQSDSLPGTHLYMAGNFSWHNFNSNPCNGQAPSDGQGLMVDTPDGSQISTAIPYSAQIVIDNNISVGNGGPGAKVFNNAAGSPHAPIYLRQNTFWANNADPNESSSTCGESVIYTAYNVQQFANIASTNGALACNGNTAYDYFVWLGDITDKIYSTLGWSATATYGGILSSRSFAYGPNNLFGTNPSFANPTIPGAPSCASSSSVPDCMTTMVANFTPTNTAVMSYGYQRPISTLVYDPLFPQWLCNVNLPSGLATMGCLASGTLY